MSLIGYLILLVFALCILAIVLKMIVLIFSDIEAFITFGIVGAIILYSCN
jgi:hypothetical protein